MSNRAQTPTIASSSATVKAESSSSWIKPDPNAVGIKREADDKSLLYCPDSNPLLVEQMWTNLSAIYQEPVSVCLAHERDMMSSCCDKPIQFGDKMLTTYKRSEQDGPTFQGDPTCFTIKLDKDGCEIMPNQREARFFHTADDECRRIATQEEPDDMRMVKRDQKVKAKMPRGRLACETCAEDATVAGCRDMMHVTVGDGSSHVFCTGESCLGSFYNRVVASRIDTEGSMREVSVDVYSANVPVQFGMVSESSLLEVCDRVGVEATYAEKEAGAQLLINLPDTNGADGTVTSWA